MSMGLRLKFLLILIVSFLIALGASSIVFYRVSKESALERLHAQIAVLRAEALAVVMDLHDRTFSQFTKDEMGQLNATLARIFAALRP